MGTKIQNRFHLSPDRFHQLETRHKTLTLAADKNKKNRITNKTDKIMKKYVCTVCNWIYDPAVGDPDSGIAPGTPFEAIPDDWACPLCGVTKEDFELVEE